MARSSRRHLGMCAVMVAMAAVACSSDDPEADQVETGPPGPTLTMTPVASASEAQLEDAVDVVEDRLDELGIDGDVQIEGDEVVVRLDEDDAQLADEAADVLGTQGALRFRPVLCQVPTEADLEAVADGSEFAPMAGSDDDVCGATSVDLKVISTTPPLENTSDAPVTLDFAAQESRFRFGPAQMDIDGSTVELGSELITAAKAKLGVTEQWEIQINMTSGPALDAFNALAAACFGQTDPCPTGQSGIIVDQLVYSVLGFQEPEFHGTAVISGSFTEAEAEDLALVLRSGALPVPFDVAVTDDPSSDPLTDSE